MELTSLLLIVFTDEVGSTQRDISCTTARQILSARASLFGPQIEHLQKSGWLILKNVGDQFVIRLDKDRHIKNQKMVVNCLIELYRGWREEFQRKLRIAVHAPSLKRRFATGKNIKEYLMPRLNESAGKANRPLQNLWPSSKFLEYDIFGFEMNLAARLVTIPESALFIISENVCKLCQNTLKIKLNEENATLSEPIPIINIRGFENIFNIDHPLMIREIRRKGD